MALKTPLYEEHVKANARIVEFAGWDMPVQYIGIRDEHMVVRNAVGIFDVSHMGEVFVRGEKSFETLQWLTTNNVDLLEEGQAQYSLLPNTQGGLVDDIIVYCIKKHKEYLVCVNASNTEKDYQWMLKNNRDAEIVNESKQWAQIAVQGPHALKLMQEVYNVDFSKWASFTFQKLPYHRMETIVARTGYTGESGVEIFLANAIAVDLWKDLNSRGKEFGVMPIGLGARDTLRTEMKYSLYGNEIDDTTNPIEAGLGWVVKLDKGEFIGRDIIARVKEQGPKRKLVGFKTLEKGIPRHGYRLLNEQNQVIGVVTSGTHSPSLNEPIGIGYVTVDKATVGSEIFVEIRDRKVKAQVVSTPFIKQNS